ncbi:MAG: DUF167 family protein [Gammaproteobacteria bacterium]|nr:DUF167 family protein [Gammaproteobacteria bacterium]
MSAERQAWYRWEGDTLTLSVRVQPKASSDEIVGPCADPLGGESLKVRITAPPVDGKANAQLVKFLAKAFGVAKSRVSVLAGEGGRQKRVQISAPTRLPPPIQR